MKPLSKEAAAQLVVDRFQAARNRTFQRRATRETVKALRAMADMLEAGEVSEWAIDRNFGYMPVTVHPSAVAEMRRNGVDTLTITFHHSLEKFGKRLLQRSKSTAKRSK